MGELTHLGPHGRARMVDVSNKAATIRQAVARGRGDHGSSDPGAAGGGENGQGGRPGGGPGGRNHGRQEDPPN